MTGAEMAVGGRPRYPLVDALRGAALVVMAGYHVAWDLFYLGVIATDITADPAWIALQRAILGSFVFLAGVSLVLAHGEAIRWRSFWRREAILVGAAIAVSIGTSIAFGPYFAFFGVLHAIALFSLLALPFLRAPLWIVTAAAAAVIAASLVWSDPAFIDPWLAWIGFWPVMPPTVDLVSVFPWFGVTLCGVLAMRVALAFARAPDPAAPLPSPLRGGAGGGGPSAPSQKARSLLVAALALQGGIPGRALAFIGRWSLVIYLLHQPVLYGGLSAIVGLFPPPQPPALTEAQEFALSCKPSCTATGTPDAYCTAYCACTLEAIEAANLWDAIGAEIQTPDEQAQTSRVINLCRAMAEGTN